MHVIPFFCNSVHSFPSDMPVAPRFRHVQYIIPLHPSYYTPPLFRERRWGYIERGLEGDMDNVLRRGRLVSIIVWEEYVLHSISDKPEEIQKHIKKK